MHVARALVRALISTLLHFRNLKKVKEVVEKEGDAFVTKQDEDGHTFVHWAALGGYNEVVNYLLDKGAPLNEHSDNDYGPRPIHWACVHGQITTIDLFVEKGVPVDTTDLNGCSPLLVAAQYGQSLAISYLLQKGANKFHVDVNGDSALHWACFKGTCNFMLSFSHRGLYPLSWLSSPYPTSLSLPPLLLCPHRTS